MNAKNKTMDSIFLRDNSTFSPLTYTNASFGMANGTISWSIIESLRVHLVTKSYIILTYAMKILIVIN